MSVFFDRQVHVAYHDGAAQPPPHQWHGFPSGHAMPGMVPNPGLPFPPPNPRDVLMDDLFSPYQAHREWCKRISTGERLPFAQMVVDLTVDRKVGQMLAHANLPDSSLDKVAQVNGGEAGIWFVSVLDVLNWLGVSKALFRRAKTTRNNLRAAVAAVQRFRERHSSMSPAQQSAIAMIAVLDDSEMLEAIAQIHDEHHFNDLTAAQRDAAGLSRPLFNDLLAKAGIEEE